MRNKSKSLNPEELTPDKARVLALKYLTLKARTHRELHTYLLNKGFPIDLVNMVVQEMKYYGYINDAQYAISYKEWKQNRGWGPLKIAYSLRNKGVDQDLISTAIATGEQDDFSHCLKVATKKLASTSRPLTKQTLLRFLQSRGFSLKIAQLAVQELYSDLSAPNLDIPPKIY